MAGAATYEAVVGSVTDEAVADAVTDKAVVGSVTDEVVAGAVTDETVVDLVTDEAVANAATDEAVLMLTESEKTNECIKLAKQVHAHTSTDLTSTQFSLGEQTCTDEKMFINAHYLINILYWFLCLNIIVIEMNCIH